MTYRDYKSFWDIFLNKWRSNHDDLIQNDPAGQAFFAINSSGNYINSDLYTSITCMPEPYYFGSNFLNATDWSDFNDAIVVLDLNPGMSHEKEDRKKKGDDHPHDILDALAKGSYSTKINSTDYSPFMCNSEDSTIPGVTWWKSKRLAWFSRFLSMGNVREKMFALELCPFHSKSWNVKLSPAAINFIREKVLAPAAEILCCNGNSRLGYCFGKDWETIFDTFGFEIEAQWGVDYDCAEKTFVYPVHIHKNVEEVKSKWPKKDGVELNRIYKLYKGNIEGKTLYFLCLRASGTFAAPGKDFEEVEKLIREDLNFCGVSL
jgi:hypothetical protein